MDFTEYGANFHISAPSSTIDSPRSGQHSATGRVPLIQIRTARFV